MTTTNTRAISSLGSALDECACIVYERNRYQGFWDEANSTSLESRAKRIALMHSELSEALEAIRHNNPPDSHCPEHSSVAVELADTIIRILDYAGGYNVNVGAALEAKLEFNRSRPHKHGKEF